MIDAPNRPVPRFPPTPAAEMEAKRLIREAIAQERELEPGKIIGLAGGACGGDILFHEICADLGIETRLFLTLPRDQFVVTSVQHAGAQWIDRFASLCERQHPRVLADSEELPSWLAGKEGYSIWQRSNLWILFNALSLDAKRIALLALWDGGTSDRPGGTADLFRQVQSRGQKVIRIPAETLRILGKK
jgi:hypothetical protein